MKHSQSQTAKSLRYPSELEVVHLPKESLPRSKETPESPNFHRQNCATRHRRGCSQRTEEVFSFSHCFIFLLLIGFLLVAGDREIRDDINWERSLHLRLFFTGGQIHVIYCCQTS